MYSSQSLLWHQAVAAAICAFIEVEHGNGSTIWRDWEKAVDIIINCKVEVQKCEITAIVNGKKTSVGDTAVALDGDKGELRAGTRRQLWRRI